MRFRIDLKIFIFLIIFYFTKQIEIYAMIMLFALIHELGHLLACLLYTSFKTSVAHCLNLVAFFEFVLYPNSNYHI